MTGMNQPMAMPVSPLASSTGAPARASDAWQDIDWRQVNRDVRRLQTRIVKAAQAGRWGKVKALQRLLTHSFSGHALAVRRVTENQGKRTPGVDGETWDTPTQKAKAIRSLRQHGYRAQPLRRVYIFQVVWRWARRRHPRKSAAWIRQKYFPPYGKRQWHFTGQIKSDRRGNMQTIRLVPLAWIPIQRHVKVRAQANPFDPAWETYFEKRLDAKMLAHLEGKEALRSLWR